MPRAKTRKNRATPAAALRAGSGWLPPLAWRLLPYAITAVVLCWLGVWLPKYWMTNDDNMMAMIVHGYGITDTPSAGLVYSNIVWGWLLKSIGLVAGPNTYTVATYVLQALAFLGFVTAFDRVRVPATLGAAILLLAFAPMVVALQFTITAGYLTAAGVTLACATAESGGRWTWLFAGSLLVLGAWVRALEFLFVVFACAPFYLRHLRGQVGELPSKGLVRLAAGVGLVLVLCQVADNRYYSMPRWDDFHSMRSIANEMENYRLGNYLNKHPEVRESATLTRNDLWLVTNWFFADPTVFNSENFQPILDKAKLVDRVSSNLRFSGSYARILQNSTIYLLLGMIAFCMLLSTRRIEPAASCLLFFGAMGFFMAAGHLPAARIYVPVLLAIAALCALSARVDGPGFKAAYLAAFLASLGLPATQLLTRSPLEQVPPAVVKADICALPHDKPLVVWGVGGVFVYPRVFRPFSTVSIDCHLAFYPIGVMQRSPLVLDAFRRASGEQDFVSALLHGKSLYLITEKRSLKWLQVYFEEHYAATFSATLVSTTRNYHSLYQISVARH